MCSKEFKVGLKYRQKKGGGEGRERVKIKNQKTKGFTKKYDPPPHQITPMQGFMQNVLSLECKTKLYEFLFHLSTIS